MQKLTVLLLCLIPGMVAAQYKFVNLGPFSSPPDIEGRLSISGNAGELSLLSRSATSFVESPSAGERWSIYNSDNTLKFRSGNDKMVLTADGKVGIGTTAPDAELTVKGDIHTYEVRVDLTGPLAPPDYVFEKDYNLLPLSEVEAYINANKHLPEVPSAKEMLANGLNLKEMNLLLLKKVEELTLHLIEANKKIENLETQVQSLQKSTQQTH